MPTAIKPSENPDDKRNLERYVSTDPEGFTRDLTELYRLVSSSEIPRGQHFAIIDGQNTGFSVTGPNIDILSMYVNVDDRLKGRDGLICSVPLEEGAPVVYRAKEPISSGATVIPQFEVVGIPTIVKTIAVGLPPAHIPTETAEVVVNQPVQLTHKPSKTVGRVVADWPPVQAAYGPVGRVKTLNFDRGAAPEYQPGAMEPDNEPVWRPLFYCIAAAAVLGVSLNFVMDRITSNIPLNYNPVRIISAEQKLEKRRGWYSYRPHDDRSYRVTLQLEGGDIVEAHTPAKATTSDMSGHRDPPINDLERALVETARSQGQGVLKVTGDGRINDFSAYPVSLPDPNNLRLTRVMDHNDRHPKPGEPAQVQPNMFPNYHKNHPQAP